MPTTPLRTYESQGNTIIILIIRIFKRLRPGPDLRLIIIISLEINLS